MRFDNSLIKWGWSLEEFETILNPLFTYFYRPTTTLPVDFKSIFIMLFFYFEKFYGL